MRSCRRKRHLDCPYSMSPLHSSKLFAHHLRWAVCRTEEIGRCSALNPGFCFKPILPNSYWKNRESFMLLTSNERILGQVREGSRKKPNQITCESWQMSQFPSVCTLNCSGNKEEPTQHTFWFGDVLTVTAALGFWLLLFEKLLANFCHLCYSSGCCHRPWLSSQVQNAETTNPLNTSAF